MTNHILLISALLFVSTLLGAQSTDNHEISKFNLYGEFGTNIIVSSASINLEAHMLTSKSGKVNLYGRAGLGAATIFWGASGPGGLGALTLITGKEKHHFETSAGIFVGSEKEYSGRTPFYVPLIDFGYRFQKPEGGFLYRAKVGTLGIGFGFGYAF